MKALEISPENLEDLLAYDDLFLDYFNAFLALPVFPQALAYNRLTGAFEEVSSPYNTCTDSSDRGSPTPSIYGATDSVRENMLQWAREERLPLFLKSKLFRELKLCKLLLRPLDDTRNSSSRGSIRLIRGYSRQSESYISSLSQSGDNSAEDEFIDEDAHWNGLRYAELFKYQRPGSKALSDPIKGFLLRGPDSISTTPPISTSKTSSDRFASGRFDHVRSASSLVIDREKSKTSGKRAARISSQVEVIPSEGVLRELETKSISSKRTKTKPTATMTTTSSTEAAFLRGARVLSAPVNYEEFIKMPFFHFDSLLRDEPAPPGEPFVTFEDDLVSEAQTETDVRNLEGRMKMTLQQMKEQVIGTYVGMESFKVFLKDTTGVYLLNFWLDCEYFKDSIEDLEEEESIETRNCLFRDIQDQYKLNLTNDAKEQITRAASNVGLSHTIFLRTQYDVLRRLRAYWISRFLMHFERQKPMSEDEEKAMVQFKANKPQPKNSLPFFPSVSLVHSMPVWPDEALNKSRTSSWEKLTSSSIQRDIKSARNRKGTSRVSASRSTKERFILALSTDKLAGGPFQNYLEENQDDLLLSNLLFWQDVTEYRASEDISADRLLRLRHAWSIYNKYISEDSSYYTDVSESQRNQLYHILTSSRDYVEASIFDNIKEQTIFKLEKEWIKFLKDDLKIFLDCRIRPGSATPSSSTDAIEISVSGTEPDILVVKRPRPWVRRVPGSTASERAKRLNKSIAEAEEIDEEKLAEQKKRAKEKRKEAERERKRAVRAAYARQREAKLKKPLSKKTDGIDGEDLVDKVGKLPTFQEVSSNKQMVNLFKNYLNEVDSREVSYMIGLYIDTDTYLNSKEGKSYKDRLSNQINKSYFDNQSKKHVPMPEKILTRLGTEKDRPRTGTLREAQKFVLGKIEDAFKEYLAHQGEELGINQTEMMSMSASELTMRFGNDVAMLSWNKRGNKTKGKQTGRAQPTKTDMTEFISALTQSACGQLPIDILYFYRYLVKHGEEDNMPLVDKDLFFYIEVQKFKDCSHAFADEELLKRKVQSLVDCFLETVYTPSLQVDIPTDVLQKILKSTQRYLNGKEYNATIFDDAHMLIFKELLPYWAGFRKSYTPPEDPTKKPITKYQKMLKKRLENIENYKIPSANLKLPAIPEGAIPAFSLSLADGIKFREIDDGTMSVVGTPTDRRRSDLTRRRLSIARSLDSRSSRKLSNQDLNGKMVLAR